MKLSEKSHPFEHHQVPGGAPEQQQRLVDLLVEATEAVMKYQPGYVSANIHKSLDGTRVTNYAQWRSAAILLVVVIIGLLLYFFFIRRGR